MVWNLWYDITQHCILAGRAEDRGQGSQCGARHAAQDGSSAMESCGLHLWLRFTRVSIFNTDFFYKEYYIIFYYMCFDGSGG